MKQVFEYHPVLGYRFVPNIKARIPHEGGGYLIEVNDSGFRSNRPFVKERTPGSRRVLFFGDSFTAGDAVANHQRFTDLLETKLPAEVYNFGLTSSGTDQQYLVWREFAQDIEHDLVVIAVFVENVRRVAARYRPHYDEVGTRRVYAKPYFSLESKNLKLHHVPPRREPLEPDELGPESEEHVDRGGRFVLLRKAVNSLGIKDALQTLTRYQPVPAYDSPDTPEWQLMRAILTQWIRSLSKPVVIMPIPLPQHIDQTCDASGYQARFAELAADLQCTLHDPLPALLSYEPEKRRRFRFKTDPHFTPEGNEVIANSLEPVLSKLLNLQISTH
jgi:lysophospholipase L1-like esterase